MGIDVGRCFIVWIVSHYIPDSQGPQILNGFQKTLLAAIASPRLAQTTKNLACLLGSSKRATRAELVFYRIKPNILPFALPFCLQQPSPDTTRGSGQSSS